MPEPLTDQIIRKIQEVVELYHRLMIVAAPSGSGKTAALQEVSKRTGHLRINVNLELSRRLLDLTERQRTLSLPRLLGEIVGEAKSDVVLLDNIEILFDISLKLDPLRLLQNISRNKTLVAAWNGSIARGHLVYATPDHPEYRRYPLRDFLIVNPETIA